MNCDWWKLIFRIPLSHFLEKEQAVTVHFPRHFHLALLGRLGVYHAWPAREPRHCPLHHSGIPLRHRHCMSTNFNLPIGLFSFLEQIDDRACLQAGLEFEREAVVATRLLRLQFSPERV